VHFNPYGGPAALVAADLVNAGSSSELLDGMVRNGMAAIKALTDGEAALIGAWARRLRPVFAAAAVDRPELVNELLPKRRAARTSPPTTASHPTCTTRRRTPGRSAGSARTPRAGWPTWCARPRTAWASAAEKAAKRRTSIPRATGAAGSARRAVPRGCTSPSTGPGRSAP